MIIDPKEDRISHINVYSKSTTELGRKLTNFARMTTPTANDGGLRIRRSVLVLARGRSK